MTDCRELCDGAPSCAPCASHDAELARVPRMHRAEVVDGLRDEGPHVTINGVRQSVASIIPAGWVGSILDDGED